MKNYCIIEIENNYVKINFINYFKKSKNYKVNKEKEKRNAQRGGRTHNLEIKSLTLYRLS